VEPRVWAPFGVAALALVAAVWHPVAALLWSPLLLGVPHLAGDLLLLVARPVFPVSIRAHLLMAVPLAGIIGSRAASLADGADRTQTELLLGGLALVAGALTASGSVARRAAVLGVVGALALASWRAPAATALAIGHAHNLVGPAVLVWWTGAAPAAVRLLGATVVIGGLLLSGVCDGWLGPLRGDGELMGLQVASLRATLAPGLGADAAARVVATFTALQLVHYATWTGFAGAMFPTVRWSDLGAPLLFGLTVLGAMTLIGGFADPAGARATYLSLVVFHGWLELAVIAHQVVGARRG
jgi:hypothetical protein